MIRIVFLVLLIINLLLAGWLLYAEVRQPEPVDTPRIDPEMQLVLLSELQSPPPVQSVPQLQPQVAMSCFRLGPYQSQAEARAIADGLRARTARLEIASTQVEANIGNWVYMEGLENRERALQVARQLDAAGIEDFYIIGTGNEENTISLGLYRESGNAERRLKRLQTAGFNASVSPRTEIVPRYWIEYATAAEGELRINQEQPENVRRTRVACNP